MCASRIYGGWHSVGLLHLRWYSAQRHLLCADECALREFQETHSGHVYPGGAVHPEVFVYLIANCPVLLQRKGDRANVKEIQ